MYARDAETGEDERYREQDPRPDRALLLRLRTPVDRRLRVPPTGVMTAVWSVRPAAPPATAPATAAPPNPAAGPTG